jgi:hypothetical protein
MERLDLFEFVPEEPLTVDEQGVFVPKTLTKFEEMKLSQELEDFSTLKKKI